MSVSRPHSDLPPVSYEALAANNRHTHANLNACIEQRQRLEEQLETLRRHDEAATQDAVFFRKQLVDTQEQLETLREAAQRVVEREASGEPQEWAMTALARVLMEGSTPASVPET